MSTSIVDLIGGAKQSLRIMDRAGDAVAFADGHATPDDDDMLALHAKAVTVCGQASVLLTGCGAWDLAAEVRALGAWHVTMIEAERDLQKLFAGAQP